MPTEIDRTAEAAESGARISAIDAVTLVTRDMQRAVGFYTALGFPIRHGGGAAEFTSFDAGISRLNPVGQVAMRADRAYN